MAGETIPERVGLAQTLFSLPPPWGRDGDEKAAHPYLETHFKHDYRIMEKPVQWHVPRVNEPRSLTLRPLSREREEKN